MTDLTKYYCHPEDLPDEQGKVICMGTFDGCHIGHRALLDHVDYAVSFMPAPKAFFSVTEKVLLLPNEKRCLYPNFIFLRFDEDLASLTPEEFIHMILETLKPARIVVGWDFHFGFQQTGTVHTLQKLSEQCSFHLDVIAPVKLGRTIVKSTRIRQLIEAGKVERANALLGYEYFYVARVIHGKGIGRSLGFPTLNLEINAHKLLPLHGVYAGTVEVEGECHKAAISLALRESGRLELEAFLLDYSGDLYGKTVKLSFCASVRRQKKFSGLDYLKTQIAKDVERVKTLLQ